MNTVNTMTAPIYHSWYRCFLHYSAENTMQNTIDDADYIINMIVLIFMIQWVKNSCHSHSIVNKPEKAFNFR